MIDISTLFFCTLPLRKLKPQILFRKGTIRRFGNWLADRQTGFTKVHKENGLPTPLPDDVRHENSNIAKIVEAISIFAPKLILIPDFSLIINTENG